MVPDRWYALCESSDLGRSPLALRRLGLDLVAWRDAEGRPRLALDRCPHKGAKLSAGRVVEGRLACPYHGFRFHGDGACAAIPAQPDRPVPHAMRLGVLPTREVHDLIWAWYGEGEPVGEPPWFDDVLRPSPTAASGALIYPIHYSRMVESNFDLYHFPFVHRSVDPGFGEQVVDAQVEVDGERILTSGAMLTASGRRTPFRVDFQPPNLQHIELTANIVALVISTPVDDTHTWVWAHYDQSFVRSPWLSWVGWLISEAVMRFDWSIVQARQDIPVLGTLTPREAAPGACVWIGADAGAARYVQWRARQLARHEEPHAPTAVRQARS